MAQSILRVICYLTAVKYFLGKKYSIKQLLYCIKKMQHERIRNKVKALQVLVTVA